MKNMLLSLLVLVVAPAMALAGGGTKGNSTIEFSNEGAQRMGVIVDAPAGFDPKKATLAEFRDAGGKFVDVGESYAFSVKTGKHQIGAAFVLVGRNALSKNTSQSVQVGKKSAVHVAVSGSNASAPTLTVTGEETASK